MPEDGRLCVGGLQHDFVMTSWNTDGATAFFADELLCPTCGAVLYRDDAGAPWRWASATDQ